MKVRGINTAAIYLRKSTKDDGKSVAAQERQLCTKAEQLAIAAVLFLTFEFVEFRDLWF